MQHATGSAIARASVSVGPTGPGFGLRLACHWQSEGTGSSSTGTGKLSPGQQGSMAFFSTCSKLKKMPMLIARLAKFRKYQFSQAFANKFFARFSKKVFRFARSSKVSKVFTMGSLLMAWAIKYCKSTFYIFNR